MRQKLLELRELIFDTAASTAGIGRIEEVLKWGQPAYLTTESKSGTTIRIAAHNKSQFAMYVHCQTSLIATLRKTLSNELQFEGNRAIVFDEGSALPTQLLRICIAAALTYHRRS